MTRARTLARTGSAVVVTALAGSVATSPDSSWYRSLDLPSWQPPTVAFPIVWTLLYADIAATTGVALDRLAKDGDQRGRRALWGALGLNLALNAGWSALFFRAHRPGLAALESALLTASSADLARRVSRASPAAGRALAPYAVWTGFATVLSATISRRNRTRA
jgi:tryptophan-rich sensory protein